MNAATVEAVGIPRDQLIGSDFADCFSEPEKARAAYELALQEGLLSDYPLALRHVSGSLTAVEYNAAVYRDARGELRAVFAAARERRRGAGGAAAGGPAWRSSPPPRMTPSSRATWRARSSAGTPPLRPSTATRREEAIGRNGTILMAPGHEGETKALIKRMLQGERGFGFETQHLRRDGSQIDVVLSLSPLRDAASEITGITIIAHDVSEQVRAERDLRESKEKFSAAFDASPDLMAITRLGDGMLLEVNEGFTRLLGYERAETVGKTTAELSIWADPQARAAFVASLAASDEISFETMLRRKDGTLITGAHSARAMEVQGEACVLSVVHDITERKLAVERVRRSEAQLRTLIDTLPDLVWLKDPEGAYLSCNPRFESFFGAAEHDIIGKTDYDFIGAEQADSFRQHDRAAMAAAVPTKNEEEVIFAEDGHEETLETIKTSVHDSDGRLIGILGVGRDITQRRQAEEAVRLHAEQLQRTVEGAVLAMSHMVESRDPYTAGHERRVGELATAIGAEMGMTGEELGALRLAGTIHDVGKIAVPAEILSKPGRLSTIEFQIIQAHPATGFDILADVDFGSPVAEMVRQHHERLDGSGYPRGLQGEEIMTEARILAVADVIEAMSSHRPYRAALGMEAALAEIREHTGTKFDADVVATCEGVLAGGFAFAD